MTTTGCTQPRSPKRTRQSGLRIIGGLEILGGLALSALTVWMQLRNRGFAGWYLMLSQGLALGFLVAGWLLLKGEPRGLAMSQLLQALQLLQVYTPWFAWSLVAGPHATLFVSPAGLNGEVGISGTFTLLFGPLRGWSGGINLIAVAATIVLWQSQNDLRQEPAERGAAIV